MLYLILTSDLARYTYSCKTKIIFLITINVRLTHQLEMVQRLFVCQIQFYIRFLTMITFRKLTHSKDINEIKRFKNKNFVLIKKINFRLNEFKTELSFIHVFN